MNEALYLPLRHAETPLERLVREGMQTFEHRQNWELARWAERAHETIHAMRVVRCEGLGQMARHIRVRLFAQLELFPSPYDPDYHRVIREANSRYVAALLELS